MTMSAYKAIQVRGRAVLAHEVLAHRVLQENTRDEDPVGSVDFGPPDPTCNNGFIKLSLS